MRRVPLFFACIGILSLSTPTMGSDYSPMLDRACELIVTGMPDSARLVLTRYYPDNAADDPAVALAMAATYMAESNYAAADRWYGIAYTALSEDERASYDDFRAIASQDELMAYARLGNEGRRTFRRSFWAARDPTPVTPVNERLLEHYRRVWDATRRYGPADGRYSVYVRFGRPDTSFSIIPKLQEAMAAERWCYYLCGGYPVAIDFIHGGYDTRYRLSGPLLAPEREREPADGEFRAVIPQGRRSPDQFILDRGATPLDLYATVSEFDGGAGATVVNVYTGLRTKDLSFTPSGSRYAAEIERGIALFDSAGIVYARTIDTVRIELATLPAGWTNDSLTVDVFQFRESPGKRLDVALQVRDLRTGRMQALRARVRIKGFGGDRLVMSDVILAGRIAPLDPGSDSPYTLGDHRVYAMPARWYARGAPLYVYYEIYHLARGSDYGDTRYEVDHTIRHVDTPSFGWIGRAARKMFGAPKGESVSIGQTIEGIRDTERRMFALETSNLEPGNYVITITIHDLNSGKDVAREQPIRIGEVVSN